jgi:hypothetical protein
MTQATQKKDLLTNLDDILDTYGVDDINRESDYYMKDLLDLMHLTGHSNVTDHQICSLDEVCFITAVVAAVCCLCSQCQHAICLSALRCYTVGSSGGGTTTYALCYFHVLLLISIQTRALIQHATCYTTRRQSINLTGTIPGA